MADDPVSLTSRMSNFRSWAARLGQTRPNLASAPTFAAALAQAQREGAAAEAQTPAQTPGVAKQAAREMEGLFLNLLWQEMWRTVGQGPGSYLPRGLEGDIYRDFLSQAYAERMAEAGGIGLSSLILSHLDR